MNKLFLSQFNSLGRKFHLLWAGQLVSQLGGAVHTIAAIYLIKELTGQPFSVGVMLFFTSTVTLILAPVSGVMADRMGKCNIIITSDICSALIAAILGGVVWYFADVSVAIIYIAVVLLAASGLFFGPAMGSLLPDIVDRPNLRLANSLYKSGYKATEFFGNALGGMIFAVSGAAIAFLLNAVSYFLAALMSIRVGKLLQPSIEPPATTISTLSISAAFRQGLHHIVQVPGALAVFVMACAINVVAAPITVILPFHCTQAFDGGAELYGILISMLAAGSLMGHLFAGLLPAWLASGAKAAAIGVAVMCGGFFAMAISPSFTGACVALFIAGLGHGFWSIQFETAMQTSISREFLGRVLSTFRLVASGLAPLGYLVGGVLGDRVVGSFSPILVLLTALLAVAPVLTFSRPESRVFFGQVRLRAG